MLRHARQAFSVVFAPHHLLRTGSIGLVVGSWLTLINQGGVIVEGAWSAGLAVKIFLNFLTPFVVANLGLVSRKQPVG